MLKIIINIPKIEIMIKRLFHVAWACGLVASVMSCEDQKFNDVTVDVDRVHVATLSEEMQKVQGLCSGICRDGS